MIKEKRCSKCNKVKLFSEYHKRLNKTKSKCKECTKKDTLDYNNRNRDLINSKARKMRIDRKEQINKRRREKYSNLSEDKINEIKTKQKLYRESNKEKIKQRRSSDNGKIISNNISARRRARKLQATPSWANINKISLVYQKAKELERLTGLKYHVDHIVPLKGKNVCGLHVWVNLQILEASLNISKGNKLDKDIIYGRMKLGGYS